MKKMFHRDDSSWRHFEASTQMKKNLAQHQLEQPKKKKKTVAAAVVSGSILLRSLMFSFSGDEEMMPMTSFESLSSALMMMMLKCWWWCFSSRFFRPSSSTKFSLHLKLANQPIQHKLQTLTRQREKFLKRKKKMKTKERRGFLRFCDRNREGRIRQLER